jgi:hypothetical protein
MTDEPTPFRPDRAVVGLVAAALLASCAIVNNLDQIHLDYGRDGIDEHARRYLRDLAKRGDRGLT